MKANFIVQCSLTGAFSSFVVRCMNAELDKVAKKSASGSKFHHEDGVKWSMLCNDIANSLG